MEDHKNSNDNVLNLSPNASKMDAIRAYAELKCQLEKKIREEELSEDEIQNLEGILIAARIQCISILSVEEEGCCCCSHGCCDEEDECCDEEGACCNQECGCCDEEGACCNQECGCCDEEGACFNESACCGANEYRCCNETACCKETASCGTTECGKETACCDESSTCCVNEAKLSQENYTQSNETCCKVQCCDNTNTDNFCDSTGVSEDVSDHTCCPKRTLEEDTVDTQNEKQSVLAEEENLIVVKEQEKSGFCGFSWFCL